MYGVASAYNELSDAAAHTTVEFDPFSLSGVLVDSGNVTINVFTIVPELPYFAAAIALWYVAVCLTYLSNYLSTHPSRTIYLDLSICRLCVPRC
jgi:hypothetical protein